MKGYLFLVVAVIFEVMGSGFLKTSNGFTVLIPSIILVLCYIISFTSFVFALKDISLSIGYSIWSGLGTIGSALIGMYIFHEVLSIINIIGLLAIIGGIIIMNIEPTNKPKNI